MDVLVTGGHGAIGRFVVEALDERGHDVVVFDLEPPDPEWGPWPAEFVKGDVTDAGAVDSAVGNVESVIHMAALKRPACEADPRQANRVNVGGTINVFEAAASSSVRVIQVSSKSVIGQAAIPHAYPTYEPLQESAPTLPTDDIYGLTKAATEAYRRAYVRKHDLDVASVRFASSYGPGKVAVPGKGMLIPDLIEGAARGDSVTVPGGDEGNDWIYFGDIAHGLVDAVEAPSLSYPVYHIGTGRLETLVDFASELESMCPDADITVDGGLNPQDQTHPKYARMDISRARCDLGYEPRYTLRDGIRDYIDRITADSATVENGDDS